MQTEKMGNGANLFASKASSGKKVVGFATHFVITINHGGWQHLKCKNDCKKSLQIIFRTTYPKWMETSAKRDWIDF